MGPLRGRLDSAKIVPVAFTSTLLGASSKSRFFPDNVSASPCGNTVQSILTSRIADFKRCMPVRDSERLSAALRNVTVSHDTHKRWLHSPGVRCRCSVPPPLAAPSGTHRSDDGTLSQLAQGFTDTQMCRGFQTHCVKRGMSYI